MKKTLLLCVALLMFQFLFVFSSYAQEEKQTAINASGIDELVYRVREFVFEQLDNQETGFSVTVTGKALEEYTYDYLLKSKTEFESQLIGEYMRTPEKDYNSLILREYTISKTVWNSAFDQNGVSKLRLGYKIKWDETKEEKEFVADFAKTKVEELIQDSDSDYQKIKILHDFVIDTYSYDLSAENEIHNPSQMIEEKTGVCSAYTGLMSMLLTSCGIENRIILINAVAKTGNTEECHTWNLVKLGGSWYHVDTTWNDPVMTGMLSKKSYDYFLVSDEVIGKDHNWEKTVYPSAEFDYSKDSIVFAFSNIPDSVDENTGISLNKAAQTTYQSLQATLFYTLFQPEFWLVFCTSVFLVVIIFRLLELKFH